MENNLKLIIERRASSDARVVVWLADDKKIIEAAHEYAAKQSNDIMTYPDDGEFYYVEDENGNLELNREPTPEEELAAAIEYLGHDRRDFQVFDVKDAEAEIANGTFPEWALSK